MILCEAILVELRLKFKIHTVKTKLCGFIVLLTTGLDGGPNYLPLSLVPVEPVGQFDVERQSVFLFIIMTSFFS